MAGSAAMAAQVTSLMWLRTTVNYQYANGSGTREALRQLYAHGGIRRFYRGFPVALVHAPLSRFGDVVCYAGTRDLDLPHWQTTAVGAVGSAAWRLALMPLDTLKTSLQVHGEAKTLARKVRAAGPRRSFPWLPGGGRGRPAGLLPVVLHLRRARPAAAAGAGGSCRARAQRSPGLWGLGRLGHGQQCRTRGAVRRTPHRCPTLQRHSRWCSRTA